MVKHNPSGRAYRLISVVVVLLVFVGVAISSWKIADQRSYDSAHEFPLLDPSVRDGSVHPEIINFDPLRQSLKNYLAGLNMSHSLYFEYLPNGINIRDSADNSAIAASLLKTIVVMDMYKLVETGKLNLDSQATVQAKDISNDANYGDPTHLKVGDQLSLRQAAQITLAHSDNTTLNLLKDKVVPLLDNNSDSIQSLDITYTTAGNNPATEQVSISARSYSSILKCLYYACFNTPQDSTQMLTDLIGSAEHNRLMAGVPAGINVAHKVGSSASTQSDCGIIYYPGKPYLVCLMFFNLNSGNVNNVDPYFQKVSQMIYHYVATSGSQN